MPLDTRHLRVVRPSPGGGTHQLVAAPISGRRYSSGVCLARISFSSSGAADFSTLGTGAVVAGGRPLSAAADVFGVDALSNFLSHARTVIESMCSCVMCMVLNVIFSVVMRDRKNGASELIFKRSDTRYDRSPTQNDRQAAMLHKRPLSPCPWLDQYERTGASAEWTAATCCSNGLIWRRLRHAR